MKLVRLIKTCLNETYSKIRIGKIMFDSLHEIRRCFTTSVFHLCFRV